MIILDWDDTLFPTSWIKRNKVNLRQPLNNEIIKKFVELDAVLFNFLKKIKEFGVIIIVSNAYSSWIELSASHLMNTYNFILKFIPVISARSMYEFKCDYKKWKHYVFKDIVIKHMNKNTLWNIISIGDAEYEYNALVNLWDDKHIVSIGNRIRYLKNIKFMSEPSINEIIDQIMIFTINFNYICFVKSHIDLKFNPNLLAQ